MHDTMQSLNCIMHEKYFNFWLGLFSKLAYSFVAIELLDFSKWKIPFLLLKRVLGIWAFKEYTSYIKRIFFAFCIKCRAKKRVLYINVNNDDSHHLKTKCTFLYIQKAKQLQNVYIYIQKAINFAISKTICVTIVFTKINTLYVTQICHEFF